MLLKLHVVATGEALAVPGGRLARILLAALGERRHELPGGASRQDDQPLRVTLEQLAVDARAVVEALEMRRAREREQVPVAGLIPRQQREMPGRALGRGAVVAAPVGHVALEADDRLHAGPDRLLVELDGAVEHAVIGEGQRLLPQRLRARDEIGDLRQAVEQRVLAVRVEMSKHPEPSPARTAARRGGAAPGAPRARGLPRIRRSAHPCRRLRERACDLPEGDTSGPRPPL